MSCAVAVLKNIENEHVIKNSHKQNITWQTTATITDKGFKQKSDCTGSPKSQYIVGIR